MDSENTITISFHFDSKDSNSYLHKTKFMVKVASNTFQCIKQKPI